MFMQALGYIGNREIGYSEKIFKLWFGALGFGYQGIIFYQHCYLVVPNCMEILLGKSFTCMKAELYIHHPATPP